MNYYEKLVKKMNRSMKEHPRSAMVMDMNSFRVIARGRDLESLSKKLSRGDKTTVVFQKPNQKAAWVL